MAGRYLKFRQYLRETLVIKAQRAPTFSRHCVETAVDLTTRSQHLKRRFARALPKPDIAEPSVGKEQPTDISVRVYDRQFARDIQAQSIVHDVRQCAG